MTVRILHAVPDMNAGGIENYIMNMYRSIDRTCFQFDFLFHHKQESFFDEDIRALGGSIVRLPVLDDRNLVKYTKDLHELFSSSEWQIVHGHIASLAGIYLKIAEQEGVPIRIAHSHGTSFLRTPKGYAKKLLFTQARKYANVRLACSSEAGRYLFGNMPFRLAKNAIDTRRFSFNEASRRSLRRYLNVEDDAFVIGHVGRFNLQKNQTFVLDIFEEVLRKNSHAYMLFVGEGEVKPDIQRKARQLGVDDRVIFQATVRNTESFYCAMDAFLLPSLFEGLPLVGIEAQCNGLPCFFSSTISREVKVTDRVVFLDLKQEAKEWARCILAHAGAGFREKYARLVRVAGYDFRDNTCVMEDFYAYLLEA